MPSPRPPAQPSTPIAPRTPACPRCGSQMQLVHIQPSPNYVNLDLWSYTCDCGESVDNFVAHRALSETV